MTAATRKAAYNFSGLPRVLPAPDGTVTASDRFHLLQRYYIESQAEPTTNTSGGWNAGDRKTSWTAKARNTSWTAEPRRTSWNPPDRD